MAEPAAPTQASPDPPASESAGDVPLYCPSCMYDMRGLTGDQCPECGFDLGADSLKRSSIPWSYRRRLNYPLVMFSTTWRTLCRPRLFCMALARPADRREALAFRLAVISMLWVVVAVCWSLAVWDDASMYLELDYWEDEVSWLAGYEQHFEALADLGPALVCLNVGLGVLFGVWLYLISGVQTYFAHRRGPAGELDSRAVTLSYYACGPMLLFIFPSLLMLASGYFYEHAQEYDGIDILEDIANAMFAGSWVLVCLVAGLCLWTCVRFTGRLAGSGLVQYIMTAALLPLSWLGITLLVFGLIPGAFLFLYFVFASL